MKGRGLEGAHPARAELGRPRGDFLSPLPGRRRAKAPGQLDDPATFRRDDSGRSPAFFALAPMRAVDEGLLGELEWVAWREGGVARLCLHADPGEPVQDMIIAKTRDAPVRPGRHLRRPQTFQAVRGRLAVVLFGEDGALREVHVLDAERPVVRVEAGTDYADFPLTQAAVYREVLAGPQDPGEWVVAGWWPDDHGERARLLAEWRSRAGG